MKLTVVIPAFNEIATLQDVVARVRHHAGPDVEIIIVDDGSTDGTIEAIEALATRGEVRAFYNTQNRGKGAAVRRGLAAATGDIVLVQDADLEYDPADYPALLEPIVAGRADVVYGSRFRGDSEGWWWRQWVANRTLTWLSNRFTGWRLTDMETCYKVFRREVVQSIHLESDRFGFEPEVTAKLAGIPGIVMEEVPIRYRGRSYHEGKKVTWRDGLKAIGTIVKYNLVQDRAHWYVGGAQAAEELIPTRTAAAGKKDQSP
uniref:Glycosyltransferase n=1 Tax=uncultured bacterium HF186_25m_27D22 TaxID=662889 RepID=C7FPL3_9BACT|nr:glycosyltransferase [uncultured bacterium HF186_25m_27D22]